MKFGALLAFVILSLSLVVGFSSLSLAESTAKTAPIAPSSDAFIAPDAQMPSLQPLQLQIRPASDSEATTPSTLDGLQPAAGLDPSASGQDTHGEGTHAEKSGGLPQFDSSTWASQLFWLALSFGFMYVFFSSKTLPRISNILEDRKNHIDHDLKMAEDLSAEAEKIKTTYEDQLKSASHQSSDAIQSVQDQSKQKLNAALTEFRQKYESQVQAMEQKIGSAKENALQDMNKIAAEIAAQASEKLAGISSDPVQAEQVVKSLQAKKAA
jgi:F-type H+-transporting ATPase subunit b